MSRFEDIDTLEIQEALVRKLKNQGKLVPGIL